MRILVRGLAVTLVVVAGACHVGPKYVPAGSGGLLDASGLYAVEETVYSTTCRGISPNNGRVEVKHAAGSTSLRILHNRRPFDGTIRLDGSFTTIANSIPNGQGSETITMIGRFTDSSFYARVNVKLTYPVACEYQLRWAGMKL
jgi:hypothetical protein